MAELCIGHLRDDDPLIEFESRESSLTEFLREKARTHERDGFGRTYIARPSGDSPGSLPVLGYYTIAMARVHISDLPAPLQNDLPGFPLPMALLGQLARDRRAPATLELGKALLEDALVRILTISDEIGCVGVVLDALNEQLVSYYQRFGFIPSPKSKLPRKMFLPLHDVRAAQQRARG